MVDENETSLDVTQRVRFKEHKKGGGAISLANRSALKEKYEMVPQKELPQVCPREDQAGVTHAISPISFKLSQSERVKTNFSIEAAV